MRSFVIVIDSLGVGSDDKSYLYNDDGANTLKHIFEATGGVYKIPNLQKLGLCNLVKVEGNDAVEKPAAYVTKMHEASVGKDTMVGHWEMMGLYIDKPFITFTETGFPDELVKELEDRTGHKYIGNIAASGTEIIHDLGEQHLKTGELILYTSADSVLQIAANEEKTGLEELYRCCEIAREIVMKPEWLLGRVIARPFVGKDKDTFTRTANRHDYALDPFEKTVLENFKEANLDVISIGKINDIFNTKGITKAIKSKSSVEGMKQTIDVAKEDFNGLCFVNLVDFDAKWGHRRNAEGYAKELSDFDNLLGDLIEVLHEDDLLIITADHGNDPTWHGTDHTREFVPLVAYKKNNTGSGFMDMRNTFADIAATLAERHNVEKPLNGTSFLNIIK
ncbi:MAG: phosphopentomutase [Erysipelotrichaceae bacterium]|nr:phosphopentomutase [Bacillota bacterium]MDY3092380.1 phosphopentomutase [Erysipelotrichaceae bacterium]